MRTLGLDPAQVLLWPGVPALVFTLPLLGVVAAFAGLSGGPRWPGSSSASVRVCSVVRLRDAADGWQFAVGIINPRRCPAGLQALNAALVEDLPGSPPRSRARSTQRTG